MTCRDLVASLIELEGGLSRAGETAARTHLAGCRACAAYAESYETAVALGRSLAGDADDDPDTLPEELVWSILAARVRSSPPTLVA